MAILPEKNSILCGSSSSFLASNIEIDVIQAVTKKTENFYSFLKECGNITNAHFLRVKVPCIADGKARVISINPKLRFGRN